MQSADPISEVAAKIASNHAHTREREPMCVRAPIVYAAKTPGYAAVSSPVTGLFAGETCPPRLRGPISRGDDGRKVKRTPQVLIDTETYAPWITARILDQDYVRISRELLRHNSRSASPSLYALRRGNLSRMLRARRISFPEYFPECLPIESTSPSPNVNVYRSNEEPVIILYNAQ